MTVARVGAAVLAVIGCLALGFMLGGLVGGPVLGGGGMGWDRLGNAPGGMVGLAAGLVCAIQAIRRLTSGRLAALGATTANPIRPGVSERF